MVRLFERPFGWTINSHISLFSSKEIIIFAFYGLHAEEFPICCWAPRIGARLIQSSHSQHSTHNTEHTIHHLGSRANRYLVPATEKKEEKKHRTSTSGWLCERLRSRLALFPHPVRSKATVQTRVRRLLCAIIWPLGTFYVPYTRCV